jgi:spermidine/putrescine transport system substrate-binding protein
MRRNPWRSLALVSLLALVGCGQQKPSEPAAPDAAATTQPAPEVGGELNLFAWSEYLPQSVVDGFSEETGIQVNYETYASNEEMLAKLISGATSYDLIQPSEYTVEALIKENKLVKLDHALIPNLANLGPEYRGQPHDPNLDYSVPYMQGTVGIVVNTEKVKEPVTSFADLFQDKYKGRIVVLDDALEITTWALATLGLGPDAVTPENLEKARPIIAKWLPLVKVYDSDSPKTALLNGDVDLGVVWSGEAAILMNEAPGKFTYTLPSEGAHMFIDSLAIPTTAANVPAAHKFIDYILRPEVSVLISADFPYTNPNHAARKLLTDAERANTASYPPGNPKLATFRDIGAVAADVDKMFTDQKAQAGN